MNVVGYTRVLKGELATGGVSIETQREKIVAYAKLHDLHLEEVFADADESAGTIKSAALQEAFRLLESGSVEGVVVCKLDRLSQSVADWSALINGYFGERAGKQLFSVADSIDTRTAAGRLVLNVLTSVAQPEREAIGERTRDALAHKKNKSEWVGKVLFGFDLVEDQVQNGTKETISETMRRAIVESGLTRYRIAKEAGIHQGVITRFLAGEREVRMNTVEALAEVLGLKLVQTGKPKVNGSSKKSSRESATG